MEGKLQTRDETKIYEGIIQKKYRNYKWLLYFSISGISIMFIGLTILYFFSSIKNQQAPVRLPVLFYWNTLVLMGSSLTLVLSQLYYTEDRFNQYKSALLLILGLGILFMVGQVTGWLALYNSGYTLSHHSSSYLYVISGIHAIHVLGAMVFLVFFLSKSHPLLKDYATSVVYFTDPIIQSQLRLFSIFWHFLGITWIYLLFFFILLG